MWMAKKGTMAKWGLVGTVFVGTVLIVVSVVTLVGAFSSGITGHSGNPASGGDTCNECHTGGITPTVSLIGPSVVPLGKVATYTLSIAGGQAISGGFNVSVHSGSLIQLPDATDTQLVSGELTHTEPKSVNDDLEVLFAFWWQAPVVTGTTMMYAAGNSVDRDFTPAGDRANTAVFPIFVGNLNQKVYLPIIRSE